MTELGYKLTQKAKDDFRHIYVYGVQTWGTEAADRYYYALLERFRRIGERPYLYQAVDFIREGYRRSVYGEHSIYYRIVCDAVEVMAILKSQDTDTSL